MKYLLVLCVAFHTVTTSAVATTNNRILLSSVLVGTALAASLCDEYIFSLTEKALLTTTILILIFPRQQHSQIDSNLPKETCTVPGYTDHPLFGCFRFVTDATPVSHSDATQQCAKDGGRLLLVNSAEEEAELVKLLQTPKRVAFIQGTRSVGSSIWLADDGTSLPYLPSVVANQAIPTATVLSLGKFFTAVDPTDLQGNYFCEI
eukprot:XP_019920104.1 PREDICTED: uncharacterized protein LOC105321432 [Crassostrea gigas]